RRADLAVRWLASTLGRSFGMVVDQLDGDLVRNVLELENRVARPVPAGDVGIIKGGFFEQRSTHAVDDVAVDLVAQTVRIHYQTAVMRGDHAVDLDPAAVAIDRDITNHRDAGVVPVDPGDTPAGRFVIVALVDCVGGARLPSIGV